SHESSTTSAHTSQPATDVGSGSRRLRRQLSHALDSDVRPTMAMGNVRRVAADRPWLPATIAPTCASTPAQRTDTSHGSPTASRRPIRPPGDMSLAPAIVLADEHTVLASGMRGRVRPPRYNAVTVEPSVRRTRRSTFVSLSLGSKAV